MRQSLSDSWMVGRVCPQAGVAGTKAERGHSCPQQCRTEVKLSDVPILLGIRELLRTRMSALRWRPKNLRALRRLSHIVIQRAGGWAMQLNRAILHRRGALGTARPTSADTPRTTAKLAGFQCGGLRWRAFWSLLDESIVGIAGGNAPMTAQVAFLRIRRPLATSHLIILWCSVAAAFCLPRK